MFAAIHRRHARSTESLWSVVGFAVLLGVTIVFGHAISETLGATGAVTGAMVVGNADVEADMIHVAPYSNSAVSRASHDGHLPLLPVTSGRRDRESALSSAAAGSPSTQRPWQRHV